MFTKNKMLLFYRVELVIVNLNTCSKKIWKNILPSLWIRRQLGGMVLPVAPLLERGGSNCLVAASRKQVFKYLSDIKGFHVV